MRDTHKGRGRTHAVLPERPSRHLRYGRVILDGADAPVALRHRRVRDRAHLPGRVGRRHRQRAAPHAEPLRRDLRAARRARGSAPDAAGCDLAEVAAPVTTVHDVQVVRFADIRQDPTLHVAAGGPTAMRDLNVLIGKNVRAGRIMAGVTFSEPGNWTSWPPHEHAAMLEEAYLYIDMPAPSFGVQLVYTDAQRARGGHDRPRGRRRVHAAGLPPQRGCARRVDQLPVDDGGQPRERRPPVRRRQRATGLRGRSARASRRQGHPMSGHELTRRVPAPGLGVDSRRAHRRGHRAPDDLGERLMVCRLRFAPRVVTAVHSHPHEQITIVEPGSVEFTVDGKTRRASAGDVLHFPSHIEHGATMLDEVVVLVDIFSPLREEFLPAAGSR